MSTRSVLARVAFGAALGLAVLSAAPPAGASVFGVAIGGGQLTDLATGSAAPTDGAFARFVSYPNGEGTTAIFVVIGLDEAATGETFGAHVHSGPCVEDQPATAGPHYNIGGPADEEHEVWLDFTVLPGGVALASTSVPFVIPEGDAGSVVIHEMATQPGGAAGGRLACLPVDF